MTKKRARICRRRHRSVQKPNLLRRVPVSVPNQSNGKTPTYVALELLLLVCYFFSRPSTAQNSDTIASERLEKVSRAVPVCEGKSIVCTVFVGDEE